MLPIVTWAVLGGFYLAFAGTMNKQEWVAAALTGLAGATLSVLLRHADNRRFRFRAPPFHTPWTRVLGKPLAALGSDVARVARVLIAGGQGACETQPFHRGDDTREAAARRALVTLALSLAPNAYVLRIADNRDELLLHRLARRAPARNRDWPL